MVLKPGQTGRAYPHISEVGTHKALEFLSKELTMQGVKELWADSILSFVQSDNADSGVSVKFYDSEKKFASSEIEDVFYWPERDYKIAFLGLTDNDWEFYQSERAYVHKYLVWKEGVWNLCQ